MELRGQVGLQQFFWENISGLRLAWSGQVLTRTICCDLGSPSACCECVISVFALRKSPMAPGSLSMSQVYFIPEADQNCWREDTGVLRGVPECSFMGESRSHLSPFLVKSETSCVIIPSTVWLYYVCHTRKSHAVVE